MGDTVNSLKLNSTIELITNENEKVYGIIYDIIKDKVFVAVSADDKEFKLLHKGEILQCISSDSKKILSFKAILTDRIQSDFPIYELSFITDLKEMQRRENVRVHCSLPIEFIDKDSMQKEWIPYEGTIVNLSASGLRLSCSVNYKMNTNLFIRFDIENREYQLNAKIVYKELIPQKERSIYHYGIKFIDIEEREREKIIQYLFALMRKNKMR